MSVKTRLLPCRCCQFSFFPSFLHSGVFDGSLRCLSHLSFFPSLSIFWPIRLPLSRAPSLSSQILPLSSFLLFLHPHWLSNAPLTSLFSVLKHKLMVYIQGSLPISEINKPDPNVKMARCSIVSDVTAVERQQSVWGQFYACGTHNEALAKSNLISFTQILSICVYRILLNCRKQSPIYKFADFFNGPLPKINLLIDLPTCSHSQLVTYWHLLRIPWRHFNALCTL